MLFLHPIPRRRAPILVALALGGAALLACSSGSPSPGSSDPQAEVVVARVGEQRITLAELRARLDATPGAARRSGARSELERMVEGLVIADELDRRGLDEDPGFAAQRDAIRQRAARDEEQLMRRHLLAALEQELAFGEEELRARYEAEKQRFRTSRVHLRQLVVADEQTATAAARRIDAGEPFAAVAEELALDPALRATGGDLGPLERAQVPMDLRSQAFALGEPGQRSDPFQAGGRWHLLQLVAREAAVVRSFESVRPQLERELARRRSREALSELVEERTASPEVEVDVAVLRELGVPEPPPRDRSQPAMQLTRPTEPPEGPEPGRTLRPGGH